MYKVIWQYNRTRMGPLESDVVPLASLPAKDDGIFEGIDLIGQPEPVFNKNPIVLRSVLLAKHPGFRENPDNDLAGYQQAFVENHDSAKELKDRLSSERDVRYAEIQARPRRPLIIDYKRRSQGLIHKTLSIKVSLEPSQTPDLTSLQGYLAPAPQGISARYAWKRPGGRGEGITIIDIESGWNFDHEDLVKRQIGVLSGINNCDDHGTAVLGIYSGDDNGKGIVGITPNVTAGAVSADYDWQSNKWNAANAIVTAADRLSPGDIILLEMHAPGPNSTGPDEDQAGFIPIEYWLPEFAAIQYAVSLGIYVIEAAGNGGEDLDAAVYQSLFNRATRDSGAIMVGGGSSPLQPYARSRIWWSNYGSRLDVQGWGEDIVTTGGRQESNYHDLVNHQNSSRCYTQSFGGTSGASPIVAGAVAAISGCVKASGRPPLEPSILRDCLASTGTPQTGPDTNSINERIGPLPDLKRALKSLELSKKK